MKNILYLLFSLAVCLFLGIGDIWAWFALSYFIFSAKPFNRLWAIALGALSFDIIFLFAKDSEFLLARVLFTAAAVLISLHCPKKLFLFFPASVIMLFFAPDRAAGAFFSAAVWCGSESVFFKPRLILSQFSRDYKPRI